MDKLVFKLVGLQTLTTAVLAVIAGFIWGELSAISLILGGFSYIIPTLLAVLVLKILQPYPVLAGAGFIAAEILKIVLSLGLMVLVFWLYSSLHFIAYLVGLLSVSHFVFLFFLKVHRHGK